MRDPDVADIVRRTLHGYILKGRALVCQHVPPEHVHANVFLGATSAKTAARGRKSVARTFTTTRERATAEHNAPEGAPDRERRRKARLNKADVARRARLRRKGIDYEFEGYVVAEAPKKAAEATEAAEAAPADARKR